jgi:nucleoside-diphosphate-sugar epimerase
MRVLQTGATGFIGTHVLDAQIRNGTVVRALAEPATLNQLHYRADVEVVLGGLHEAAVLMRAVKGAEVVLHLAGKIPGSPVSDLFEVNVRGTGNLLTACSETGVRRSTAISGRHSFSATVYAANGLNQVLP